VSNVRRARWTTAEVTAATAVDDLEAALDEETADTTRTVVTETMVDVLTRHGVNPDLIAEGTRQLLDEDDDYWLDIAGWLQG
jgi:hypothetical protein